MIRRGGDGRRTGIAGVRFSGPRSTPPGSCSTGPPVGDEQHVGGKAGTDGLGRISRWPLERQAPPTGWSHRTHWKWSLSAHSLKAGRGMVHAGGDALIPGRGNGGQVSILIYSAIT